MINGLKIDVSAIKDNLQKVRDYLDDEVRLIAVIKANAYGHGIAEVAGSFIKMGWIFLPSVI